MRSIRERLTARPVTMSIAPRCEYRKQVTRAAPTHATEFGMSKVTRESDRATPFSYQEMFPLGDDSTRYRKLSTGGVATLDAGGRRFLTVEPAAIRALTREAIGDISHLFRASHLQQLRNILDDPESSANDRFVALDLLKNAAIASGFILPSCQDTGTAIIKAKKGQAVLVNGDDRPAISQGVYDAYADLNLRYSQMAPKTTWDEVNTGNNLPAEMKIEAVGGDTYKFLFITKVAAPPIRACFTRKPAPCSRRRP